MTTIADCHVDIITYADELTEDVRRCYEGDDGTEIYERFLDVAVFRRVGMPDSYRVEFLITCGGPTVRVTVDDDSSVSLFHSWGIDKDGNDRKECDFRHADTEFWRELAEHFNECAG